MASSLTLEDRAIQALEQNLPQEKRPLKRCALIRKATKVLRKELQFSQQEAQALAEIWVDKEDLIIDREPYEIIEILRADVEKRSRQKKQMMWVFGSMVAFIVLLAIFSDFSNFAFIGSFAAMFSASALMGGRAQLAVRHADKLRRPEALAPLAEAYKTSDKNGRAAALPALKASLESCAEAPLLEAETLATMRSLASKGPDDAVKEAARVALRQYESRILAGPDHSAVESENQSEIHH
jgi:hypothetical protein